MAEIKKFPTRDEASPLRGGKPTKEKWKPEKTADVFNIEEARKNILREVPPNIPFAFPDTKSEEFMETVSGLIKKLFEDSQNKKTVVDQLRKLANELEQRLS